MPDRSAPPVRSPPGQIFPANAPFVGATESRYSQLLYARLDAGAVGVRGVTSRPAHRVAFGPKTPFALPPRLKTPVFDFEVEDAPGDCAPPPSKPAIKKKTDPLDFDFEVDDTPGDRAAPPPAAAAPPRPRVVVPFRGTTEYREQYPKKEVAREATPRTIAALRVSECLAAAVPEPYYAKPEVRAPPLPGHAPRAPRLRRARGRAQRWVARTGTPYQLIEVNEEGHLKYRREAWGVSGGGGGVRAGV